MYTQYLKPYTFSWFTFLRVSQQEEIWVFWVIGHHHHPSYHRYVLIWCWFELRYKKIINGNAKFMAHPKRKLRISVFSVSPMRDKICDFMLVESAHSFLLTTKFHLGMPALDSLLLVRSFLASTLHQNLTVRGSIPKKARSVAGSDIFVSVVFFCSLLCCPKPLPLLGNTSVF